MRVISCLLGLLSGAELWNADGVRVGRVLIKVFDGNYSSDQEKNLLSLHSQISLIKNQILPNELSKLYMNPYKLQQYQTSPQNPLEHIP